MYDKIHDSNSLNGKCFSKAMEKGIQAERALKAELYQNK